MRIPSKKACYKLICETDMMDHIVAHSILVCRVAIFLVDQLGANGIHLKRNLVQASALLHDITKTTSFKTKEDHALTGARFLEKLGYNEVANIVRQHVVLDNYLDNGLPDEAEIINYADKRVLHDKVVSLQEREQDILRRYGKGPEYQQRIRWLWEKTVNLEKRIFGYLSIFPEELHRHIESIDNLEDFSTFRDAFFQ